MQPAAQLQFMNQLSPSGQCIPPPQPIHCLPDKVGRASAQQYEARKSKEQLPQQPAQSKMEPRRIPRLRVVVESQAFKNILVDEMDMMLSRAATLIQANWRGYRLRQKLISQMLAAKAIQEAWRRFNTRRLLRFSKVTVKRVSKEEGDIPYHPPQQVRFQPPEDKPLQVQPVMMSKETQFPSSDSLITCIPQLGLLQHPAAQGMAGPGVQAPHGPGAHGVAFLPHQTIAMRLPSPVSLDPKCQPCLLTKTVRSSCLIRHLEGDTVKTKHVTTRATRAGAPEPPPSGRYGQAVPGTFKAQIQAHVEADTHKTPPQAFPASTLSKTPPKRSPLVSITRTQAQVSPISTVTKTPPQTGPGPIMTVMKTLPQTGPSPTVTRTQAQMRQTPSLTNAPLQSRLAATMAKIPPQVCLLASVMRPPCPARPGATTARPPPQTCPVSAVTKPTPQIRLVTAPTKNQMQTCQAATVTKTPSQVCPGASIMKPPPQTRLAAMIAKTPAPIRSVAAVLRTLCLVPPVVGNLRTPPQTAAGSAGIPRACCTVHLNAQKGKVMVNVRQTAGVKDSSHSFLAEGKVRSVPQPHLEAGAPKPMARGPLEPEKVRTCLQRQVKKETVSKTNMTMEMTQPLPWTKVAEDRNKSPPQAQQRIDLNKVQSQVSVPVEAAAALPRDQMASPLTKTLGQVRPSPRQAKALPQEQLTTPLTKTLTQLHPATEQAKALSQQAHLATCPPTAMPQPHLATCLTKTTSQVHLTSEQTKVLSQGHLSTTLAKTLPQPPRAAPLMTASPLHSPAKQTKAGPQAHLAPQSPKTPSQVYPPSRLTKTPSLAHLVTCLTKAQSQVHLSSGAVKIQSQAELPVGLTKTQSQAQLVSQTKSFLTARQSTDLNSKTQSQPLLTGSRASAPSCQHLGAMSFLPRPKSEDRPAQLQPQGHVQSKTTHGPCPVASEAQGMLVPLMTSTGQPTCNIEPWGDSGTARAQPPVASQAVPCQEVAASQIASLCAELAAVLGSQEDIRALLAKALSQGEVRAALNQALSKDVLGTTVTKAMPQGMLGMALVKALSWGELGVTLSRALSRGELRSELTKVMQGKLAEVLSKALTDEERAALGQALCQGELGAVLSQSLSQAALRTGAILPKASSKAVGSGMTLLPASVEVDCRGNASAAWGSAVGPGSPQPSKVRVSQVGGWEDFTMGQHAGLLEEMGDGATLEGSPCSTLFPVGMSLTGASPLLAQASMAHLGPLSLSQPCMATGLACGLSQPSVIYGVGRGLCEPAPGPRVDPTLQASRVSAGAPGLCPPSVFLSLGSGRSYSCVPGRLGLGLHQPPLDVGVGTCEDPAVADRVVSNLQDAQFSQVSLGLHQPSSVWGRHPTAVSMSAPNLYQTDMTKEVTQGPSMFHSTWLKGMSACSSEGPAAAGMLLSLSQGATPASLAGSIFQKNMVPSMGPSQCQVTDGLVPMASQVLERGVSLTHGETSMATGMDPSRPRVALPSRLGTSQDPLSVFHLGLRTSQATIPLPMPLDHQLPAVPTVVPSSYPYARIVPEDSVMGTASGSLASSSADRRLTPAMVPNAVANFMACSLSRGSVIRGMGQGLPQGSMVTGMAQSRLLDPTASGMARSLPPGTGAGRVAPHQMAASGAKGKRLGLAMGPLARFTAPSLSPGLVAPGVGPSVPLGSVKTGGQGPPQGSMLIGLTPRPYHGAGEGPAALLQAAQAAHAAGLAQVHPQASGAQGTTRAQHRVPTVLSRASPFTQDPRILTLGTIEDPTKLKPRELGGALAQESGSDRESNKSKVLEVTPWMYQSPMDNYVETPRGPPRAEETLPKGQMSLLGERAPGQASGMAPIPFRARHSMTSSFSASLQPDSASPRGPPSTYLITTSRAHSLQLGTAVDRAMPQPLTPVVSDDFSALQPESKTHMRPPSQGSLTSDIVLMSPHLTSPVASSLYAGSVARTESSGVLQRSGSSNVAPHVQPYQSLVKKAVPGHSQMAPVPSTFQKPVSGNLTQTSLKSLRPKKYYRLIHGKLIPELLEGSMTTVVPSNQVQRQETQSPLASRRHSPCELWVGRTPTIQPSDTAYDPSVTRLSPGVRRVSLGYTTSPSGLWRPLLEQDSHESMHLVTRQHKPFPTPSVHQGQISHHAVGPVAGLHKPSLVPTVLQGPVDAGLASGVPSVAVRPMDHAVAPQSTWETARGPVPWDTLGSVAAVSPRQPGELMVSVQTMEKILVRAAVVIQAFARGYLVRSTIRVWHQCATVIQASWRGFRVRRNLARLYRATTIIQAAWRGYCTRRDCAQQMLLPAVWVELGSKVRAAPQPRCFQGSEARLGSGHRCFQSCQPHICSLCQSLSPGLGNPPSVVMLVGSSPRTCHMCGHTLPTRVVHGTGRSISSPGGLLWACSSPKASQGLCRSPGQNRAAMAIQSAWRGFKTCHQLCQQQSAAKMVQSNWRGHYTRSCLTTDMLLGSGAPRDCSRDPSRHSTHSARSTRWPGV
ncbi:hypothetical protein GHT09_002945 [Marmota monax]|uniref:IQ domain-containing protein N n=1 Tax=Marmota monax TaxID=9995 RepID=A0A834R0A7_MARMO|nr:hypothetical protein GHT09_002945 [Marmota monax]